MLNMFNEKQINVKGNLNKDKELTLEKSTAL